MVYPGRVIIIGRTPDGRHDVVIYAVTGRSPSSRARRLVHEGSGTVRTGVTDPDLPGGGNEKLLLYRCLRPFPGGLAVSNGVQTDLIAETACRLAAEQTTRLGREVLQSEPPAAPAEQQRPRKFSLPPAVKILQQAFRQPHHISGVDVTTYEPDAPAFTPRISGCLAGDAGLAIARRLPDGRPRRQFFPVPLIPGQGRLLATYTGEDGDPLPSFEGEPRPVGLAEQIPQETAAAVFEALGPKETLSRTADLKSAGLDRRVGVAALFRDRRSGQLDVAIVNRTEGDP